MKVAAPAHSCACGISASMHVIARIEDLVVIKKIPGHLRGKAEMHELILLPESRAPPAGLFD